MQKEQIEKYIKEMYNVNPDFPWENDNESAVFRHIDNKKWFALILKVGYDKLNIKKEGFCYAINLKYFPEMIGSITKENGVNFAYHMNKEHWITVLLDGTVKTKKICDLIDISFDLTMKK